MTYCGIFDTHAHYDDEMYGDNRADCLRTQFNEGVKYIINCGSNIESSKKSVELACSFPGVYAAVGIHPEYSKECADNCLEIIKDLAKKDKVVAIGEIGLDYHYDMDRDLQKKLFHEQLALANILGMPVEIHDRDAHGDIFEAVRKFKPSGTIHRFSGSPESAQEMTLKYGMFLGIGGAVTYKNSKKERETVKVVPIEKILLETDCPYQAPVPFRGTTCVSSMVSYVAEEISEIKGDISPQEVIDITAQNAKRLFKINE